MNNVIQGNFKQVEKHYGHKKISQTGVEDLQAIQKFILNKRSLNENDLLVVVDTLTSVLNNEVMDKHFMSKGNQEI